MPLLRSSVAPIRPSRSASFGLATALAAAFLATSGCDRRVEAGPGPTGSHPDALRAPSQPAARRTLAPADLAKTLADPAAKKPTILFVGPEQLFVKHIPGAKNAGEAGEPEGLASLTAMAKPLPRDTEIVIYCGCCPTRNCPNIRPAYAALTELGFTNVRALDLPQTFRADWREKGYPVEP